MIIIVCLDDAGGMMFNKRRQSRDRAVISDILKMCKGSRLWVNHYTAGLFKDSDDAVVIDEAFCEKAAAGEYCFAENILLMPYIEKIEKMIVYRWNRKYPADFLMDIDLQSWPCESVREFAGFSHEKITKEIYIKSSEHVKKG